MQSDRELLELAAKAAGLTSHRYCEAWKAMASCSEQGNNYSGPSWNPLTDDGDALRLAADLDLFGSPSYWHWLAIARLENSVDKHANVRRAIVRAAAEIGAQAHPDNKDGGANG